jgi:hypothetical protein
MWYPHFVAVTALASEEYIEYLPQLLDLIVSTIASYHTCMCLPSLLIANWCVCRTLQVQRVDQ